MQIAVPRTQDAGRLQEQHQQRNQNLQNQVAHELQKDAEKKLQSVVKEEQKQPAKFHEKEGNPDKGPYPQRAKKKKKDHKNTNNQSHPYKGKSIDYSG